LLLVALGPFAAAAAAAADGDLDPAFGAGIYRFGYDTPADYRCALLRQPDGALVVAGYGGGGVGAFLARLDAGGALDASFGPGGVVAAGPGAGVAGTDLALQPDGMIVLAVAHSDSRAEAFVTRFNTAGQLDLSFGTQGLAWTGLSPLWGGAVAVAASQGGQGTVYVAAHDFGEGVGVVRFSAGGVLDASFGAGGVASPGFDGDPDCGLGLALASGILLAGYEDVTLGTYVTRFAWSGLPDPTFGDEGTGTVRPGVRSLPYADVDVATLPDGGIMLAGYDLYGDREYVFRLDAGGHPDPAFGAAGFAPAEPGADPTCELGVAAVPDGGVALAGFTDAEPRVTRVTRFDAAGAPDPAYGVGGVMTVPIWRDIGSDVALVSQPDGALVMAGVDDVVGRLFVARFVAPGILDATFRAGGIVRADLRGDQASGRAVAIQGNGATLLASFDMVRDAVCVQRFDSTGMRDPEFGAHGIAVLAGIQPLPTSPIVVLTEPGSHRKYVGTYDTNANKHCILRLDPSGSLDATWGTGGIAYSGLSVASSARLALALQADGKVLVAMNRGGSAGIRMTRLGTNGVIDVTFGGGMVTPGWASVLTAGVAVASAADGSVYVAGLDATLGRTRVARFSAAGVLDTGFGSGGGADPGVAGTLVVDLALAPGILLAGVDATANRPYVARFRTDGTLDPAFGSAGSGLVRTTFDIDPASPVALAAETQGWIYLAGHHLSGNFVARFSPDGVANASFGAGGVATTGGWTGAETVIDLAIGSDGKVVLATNIEDPFWGDDDVLARFQASPRAVTAVPAEAAATDRAQGDCFPNPFRHDTVVRFTTPTGGPVRAAVYDMRGRRVATLTDGHWPAGSHDLPWSGRDWQGRQVAAGVYFVRVQCGGAAWARKVVRVED